MLGNIEKDHMELERHLLTAATEAEKVFMNKDDRYDGPWGAGISTVRVHGLTYTTHPLPAAHHSTRAHW